MAARVEHPNRHVSTTGSLPRVVFVNRYFYPDESATSQLLSDLAFHLAGESVEVHVVVGRQHYDDPRADLPARDVIRGVHVHRSWSTRFGRGRLATRAIDYLSFYASAAVTLLRVVRRRDVLVAETDPPLISVPAAAVARIRGARLVNWAQDLFPEVATAYGVRAARGPLGALARAVRNWAYHSAACNVALGEAMAARLRAVASRVPVHVIPNWSDGEAITPMAPADNPLRATWGLKDRFVVGYSGNMGRAHDAGAMLAAAQALADEPRVRFLIVGGGVERDRLLESCHTLGVSNMIFRPFQPRERLRESLSVPDVHLVSLRPNMEGLVVPSKLYGVLAAGRPVIFIGASRGEIARLVEETGCGIGVDQSDPDALVAAIRELVSDSERCRAMGRRARSLFEERFDQPVALRKWRDMLASLA